MVRKDLPASVRCLLCRPNRNGFEYRGDRLARMGEHAISAHGVADEDLKKSRLAPGEGGQVYLLHLFTELFSLNGIPEHMRSDNGPEMTTHAV